MSCLFMEGFYLYNSFAQMIDGFHGTKWEAQGSDGGTVLQLTGGEDGQPALEINFSGPSNGNAWAEFVFPLTTTIIFGCRMKLVDTGGTGSDQFLGFLQDTTITSSVFLNSSGSLDVLRGTSTQVATTGAGVISDATWHDIEVKMSIQNSPLGLVSLVVDGVKLIDEETGFDLQQAGTPGCDAIRLYAANDTLQVLWSDLYVLAVDGTPPNDFLKAGGEPKRVFALRPTSDGATDFTPTPGPNNFAMVDDDPDHDFDTTFNVADGVGDKDILNFPTAGILGDVDAVQISYAARTNDGGARNLRGFQRQGATQDNGASEAIALAWNIETAIFDDDANGAAWTKALLNSSTFGYEIV